MRGRSFGAILDEHGGIGPGFDFARIVLAFGVLGWHAPSIATGNYTSAMDTPAWVLNFAILPMFFGLSGFLVAGSAQRLGLGNFALNRGLRIFPALIVEIVLSAFVLGPIFTTVPLGRYFTDRHFLSYLLNMAGWVHFHLPGVFAANPSSAVNGSLWTVPFELACYIVMAILMRTGAIRRGGLLVGVAIMIVGASVVLEACAALFPGSRGLQHMLEMYVHFGKGPALLPCFVLGAALYTMRHHIPADPRIALAACAVLLAFGVLATPEIWRWTPVTLLTAPAMIYIVCFVGVSRVPAIPYFGRGDYSYGIYLYGYPIQQALMTAFVPLRSWPLLLIASAIVVTLFATFSWHVVEKPILRLRRRFSFVDHQAALRADRPAKPLRAPA